MNQHQISIIKSTAGRFDADVFYDKLFELDPSTRDLFKSDRLPEQKFKLRAALALVVAGVERFDTLVPTLEKLGSHHSVYGVKPHHYKTVGEALVFALDLTDPEEVNTWQLAYDAIAGVMIKAGNEVKP